MLGDPTEAALVVMGRKLGIQETELRHSMPRIGELPFDSDRKLMTTVHRVDGVRVMFTKGALDILLPR